MIFILDLDHYSFNRKSQCENWPISIKYEQLKIIRSPFIMSRPFQNS